MPTGPETPTYLSINNNHHHAFPKHIQSKILQTKSAKSNSYLPSISRAKVDQINEYLPKIDATNSFAPTKYFLKHKFIHRQNQHIQRIKSQNTHKEDLYALILQLKQVMLPKKDKILPEHFRQDYHKSYLWNQTFPKPREPFHTNPNNFS